MSIDPSFATAFLDSGRLVIAGVSDEPSNFGRTVYDELRAHGYDVVAVNPYARIVRREECYPDIAAVPGPIGAVIVMVSRDKAVDVVNECVAAGVRKVWLFKGFGAGAVSDEAVAVCEEAGIEVVAGACPLMFLEPVHGIHRFHRALRRMTGAVDAA